jgi:predicted adenine nucleotide alpha hydrolase (AANH) superfamily ATPase
LPLLVHTCCAECLASLLGPRARLGRFAAFFYNPNIQPLIEFRRRLKSVRVLAEQERLEVLVDDGYDPKGFLRAVPWDRPERCLACYRLRLAETARVAAERGFAAITTTLLTSTHQDHEAVARIGREAAAARGLEFHYEDWRPLAAGGHEEAKRRNLYRQQYCGCLFSEEERFAPTRLHLFRGGTGADAEEAGGDA